MKIYFAYRTGYVPNNRLFRAFEAESVFDWFVQNWTILTDNNDGVIKDFLGVRPYGFPISDYKTEKQVPSPLNLADLEEKLASFVYSNEVIVSKDCVKVLTDDDEIELGWYVFDENYASKNLEKVSIWFNENLPAEYENEPYLGNLKSKKLIPNAEGKGNTYFMSSTIYDGSNLEDLEGVYQIKGVGVPDLLEYFRKNDLVSCEDDYIYALSEIQFIQQLCKIFPNHNQKEIFEELAKYPFTELFEAISTDDISNITPEKLENLELRGANPALSKANSNEHLVEVITNSVGEFYNYTIIFDDYWLNKNQDLGKSLARFCGNWDI